MSSTMKSVQQMLHEIASGTACSPLTRISVFESIRFENLSENEKCELAKFFVLESCPTIGAFTSNGDALFFISCVAAELAEWPNQDDIAGRRLEHVAFALSAVAQGSSVFSPPGALAATYLLHQIEFLFRAMSGSLTLEGTFVNPTLKDSVEQQLGRTCKKRINDIDEAYQIMKLNKALVASKVFHDLDTLLPHGKTWDGHLITNLGERISNFRHPVSHGPLADPSAEGPFYGLVMSIALYGSQLFPRT